MGIINSIKGLLRRMAAVKEPQHIIVQALYAYAEAVESQATQRCKIVGGEVLGVCLNGHLLEL